MNPVVSSKKQLKIKNSEAKKPAFCTKRELSGSWNSDDDNDFILEGPRKMSRYSSSSSGNYEDLDKTSSSVGGANNVQKVNPQKAGAETKPTLNIVFKSAFIYKENVFCPANAIRESVGRNKSTIANENVTKRSIFKYSAPKFLLN